MVKCPRCDSLVDETSRTTCPQCFTPLSAGADEQAPSVAEPAPAPQAAPLYMPGQNLGGNRRVTLTGEVIEVDAPTEKPSYTGGSPSPAPAAAPRPIAATPRNLSGGSAPSVAPRPAPSTAKPSGGTPAAPSAPRPAGSPVFNEAPAQKSGSSGVAFLVILVLALAGGGWWYLQNRSNPKDVAEKWLRALIAKDYQTFGGLMITKEGKPLSAAEQNDLKQNMQKKMTLPLVGEKTMEEFLASLSPKITKVGEPKFENDTAEVEITMQISLMGQTRDAPQKIPLKKAGSAWMVNLGGKDFLSAMQGGGAKLQ